MLLTAEPRCKGGDIGIIGTGKGGVIVFLWCTRSA